MMREINDYDEARAEFHGAMPPSGTDTEWRPEEQPPFDGFPRQHFIAEPDPEPLPKYDEVMCEGAIREIREAKDALESGGQINYEEIAVGLVSDYGDTLIRALESMRENVRRAA